MDALTEDVYQITAPHFCAGVVVSVRNKRVIDAAPILRWAIGRRWTDVLRYFHRKHYRVVSADAASVPGGLTWLSGG
jgi:hypothetical protein